ncbi:MAG: CPXCG motif-containing cysteine-rich protein [Gammaproteobacteria bacterium]|nr:CPXCG motif-containing cysteine-rich protein [Gammaproteobacteria bacterium]MBL7000907.1 CPXCG motif-containing cysteine-rich protein [Gammaproteobacteria bacterium]
MNTLDLQEAFEFCPYCGERISVLIENSEEIQQYIEDCEVCCQPITIITQRIDELHFELRFLTQDDIA